MVDNFVQCLFSQLKSIIVRRVKDIYDGIVSTIVMMPKIPKPRLSSNVPHSELHLFVGDFFDVEANCGDSSNCFIELHLVENGSFTSTIKPKDEYLGLHLREGIEDLVEEYSHLYLIRVLPSANITSNPTRKVSDSNI